MSESTVQFWHWYLGLSQTFQVQGPVLYVTVLTSNISCKFAGAQASLPTDRPASFESSHFPFRFINSLEWLREPRKALYLQLQFYYSKRIHIRTSQCKRPKGAVREVPKPQASMFSPRRARRRYPLCTMNCIISKTAHLSFGVWNFCWGFIT